MTSLTETTIKTAIGEVVEKAMELTESNHDALQVLGASLAAFVRFQIDQGALKSGRTDDDVKALLTKMVHGYYDAIAGDDGQDPNHQPTNGETIQ